MLKLITWNVNSINSRLERTLKLLDRHSPDILCLQELKCLEEKFPLQAIKEKGYEAAILGQKTYNGVAILTKKKSKPIALGIPNYNDPAARMIAVEIHQMIIINIYVPNGQEVDSEKYQYKMEWLNSLRKFISTLLKSHPNASIYLLGDFNIAPADLDVHDPVLWHEKILCSSKERAQLNEIFKLGFKDLYREFNINKKEFSWWDYRNLGFPKNLGLRIDLILGNEKSLSQTKKVWIDREERKGEKPSDHAPVIVEISI